MMNFPGGRGGGEADARRLHGETTHPVALVTIHTMYTANGPGLHFRARCMLVLSLSSRRFWPRPDGSLRSPLEPSSHESRLVTGPTSTSPPPHGLIEQPGEWRRAVMPSRFVVS
jgi:hypothetical protein